MSVLTKTKKNHLNINLIRFIIRILRKKMEFDNIIVVYWSFFALLLSFVRYQKVFEFFETTQRGLARVS